MFLPLIITHHGPCNYALYFLADASASIILLLHSYVYISASAPGVDAVKIECRATVCPPRRPEELKCHDQHYAVLIITLIIPA